MRKNIFFINFFFVLISSFGPIFPSTDHYKISQVPCSIEKYIQNDKIYLHVTLGDGLEIPCTFQTFQSNEQMVCGFKAKIIDGSLYPDSEGNPLTDFNVVVKALCNPKTKTVTLTIKKVTQVVEMGWILVTKHTSEEEIIFTDDHMLLNGTSKPELSIIEGNPRQAYIIFDIILAE